MVAVWLADDVASYAVVDIHVFEHASICIDDCGVENAFLRECVNKGALDLAEAFRHVNRTCNF